MNDQDFPFDPEDPRLTAYALGELHDPADRAAVEQTLQSSPEARAALREIRVFTALLTAEYKQERAATDEIPAALPSNVVAMPSNWPRRLLLAAAMLLLLASVASVIEHHRTTKRKTVASVQKHGSGIESGPVVGEQAQELNLPKDAATKNARPSALAPASAPGPLLANNVPALAQDPDNLAAANSAQRVVVTGSNLPTSEEVGVAPVDTVDAARDRTGSKDVLSTLTASARPVPSGGDNLGPPSSTTRFTSRSPSDESALQPQAGRLIAQTKARAALSAPAFASSKDTQAAIGSSIAYGDTPPSAKPAEDFAIRRTLPSNGFNTAVYEHLSENPFLAAKDNPLSTFSVDVDTASYANVRRFIESGRLPPPDAVRVEELVNYFPYDYAPPAPDDEAHPFAVHLEAASCPWNPPDRLVRIGIKARELARDKRPASNLVFLIDVSGSMEPPERLPLIKASMRMLVEQLTENDRVAIVTYAGESGVALPSTAGDHKEDILRALDKLEAGGSTNGASGIKLAYKVAREGFIQGGTNRVILATDGDFNVGVTSQGDLVRLIQGEAKSGVSLSALGVGTDNYKDATMQKLADKGNGNYAYIDQLDEARKVLVEQMSGTLVTVAKDVKIQVEFNPATVAAYRLIGYEKRALRKEDFNDDRIDAGEIGAGHRVTALYEVVPVGQPVPGVSPAVDALKYGQVTAPRVDPTMAARPEAAGVPTGELLTVKMRHKTPEGDKSERSYEAALTDHAAPGDFANATPDFKFAAAVASFGLVLRDSPYKGNATLGAAIELAQDGKGADPGEYRAGFIELAKKAQALQKERGE